MIYPGLFKLSLKAGVSNLIILFLSSTKFSSTLLITISALSLGATPDSIEKLCDNKSILHSELSTDPNLSPLSKYALKYQSLSHAFLLRLLANRENIEVDYNQEYNSLSKRIGGIASYIIIKEKDKRCIKEKILDLVDNNNNKIAKEYTYGIQRNDGTEIEKW